MIMQYNAFGILSDMDDPSSYIVWADVFDLSLLWLVMHSQTSGILLMSHMSTWACSVPLHFFSEKTDANIRMQTQTLSQRHDANSWMQPPGQAQFTRNACLPSTRATRCYFCEGFTLCPTTCQLLTSQLTQCYSGKQDTT